MDLSPRQLGVLREIGIPLWELRSNKGEASAEPLVEALIEPSDSELISLDSDVLIMLSLKEQHPSAMNLLSAMLNSIGLNFNHITIINPNHLQQVKNDVSEPKLLVVMGEECGSEITGESDDEIGQIQHNYFNNVSLLMTVGLDALLASPSKKQIAWQALLQLKHYLDESAAHA